MSYCTRTTTEHCDECDGLTGFKQTLDLTSTGSVLVEQTCQCCGATEAFTPHAVLAERHHLSQQEVSEAEVEAAAAALLDVDQKIPWDEADVTEQRAYRKRARAALVAARRARGENR